MKNATITRLVFGGLALFWIMAALAAIALLR